MVDSSAAARIAIFASGQGSNATRIMSHFRGNAASQVVLLASNKPDAPVLARAAEAGVPALILDKERFFRGDAYVPEFRKQGITHLVLAGFLWKIPPALIRAYPDRILNIHPALLPKFGGKGMYGRHVHEAVLAAGETRSGITVHLVDDQYDHGKTLFQAECPVLPGDDADSLAARIHALEHAHFPGQIERWIAPNNR